MLMPAASLEVVGLRAGYGPTIVLEDVSFKVPAGGRLAVLGRNGTGKTTLLSSLMGVIRQTEGKIIVGGAEISGLPSAERARAGLGLVPQTRDIFPSLTVEENLIVGLKDRPRSALGEAYDLFPRLRERSSNLGWQLSGGEQQMLSTARTILGRPSVLLLDEPLEGLAPVLCEALMTALKRLASMNAVSVVLAEHRLESVLEFAEDVLILERGCIAWSGASSELKSHPCLLDRYLGVGALY
jgi:branched-chain amino acid transport system ATP-binding protein